MLHLQFIMSFINSHYFVKETFDLSGIHHITGVVTSFEPIPMVEIPVQRDHIPSSIIDKFRRVEFVAFVVLVIPFDTFGFGGNA